MIYFSPKKDWLRTTKSNNFQLYVPCSSSLLSWEVKNTICNCRLLWLLGKAEVNEVDFIFYVGLFFFFTLCTSLLWAFRILYHLSCFSSSFSLFLVFLATLYMKIPVFLLRPLFQLCPAMCTWDFSRFFVQVISFWFFFFRDAYSQFALAILDWY